MVMVVIVVMVGGVCGKSDVVGGVTVGATGLMVVRVMMSLVMLGLKCCWSWSGCWSGHIDHRSGVFELIHTLTLPTIYYNVITFLFVLVWWSY